MSELINRVYASAGPETIIDTIQLDCDVWDEPIRLVMGYEDMALGFGDGTSALFKCAPIQLALPKKDNKGNQSINFAIDNVTGEAQRRIDTAIESESRVMLTFRRYLDSDLTQPAENPFRATILGGTCEKSTVQLEAGFFDLMNIAWPRRLYTSEFAPGLKYL